MAKRKRLSLAIKTWLRGYRLYGFSPYGAALYVAQQTIKRHKRRQA